MIALSVTRVEWSLQVYLVSDQQWASVVLWSAAVNKVFTAPSYVPDEVFAQTVAFSMMPNMVTSFANIASQRFVLVKGDWWAVEWMDNTDWVIPDEPVIDGDVSININGRSVIHPRQAMIYCPVAVKVSVAVH